MLAGMEHEMLERQQGIDFGSADQPADSFDIVRARQFPPAFPAADLALRYAQAFGDSILAQARPDAPGAQLAADISGPVVIMLEHHARQNPD